MSVKNHLKEIRMREYLIESKSEFARFLEVNEHAYIKWENEKSAPSMEVALMVAKKLNKKVDDIWYLG
ncbi:DNA-binding XRE family transcriptional regulator [Clostridium acetobutylicum]|uniref:Predicted transcriptional regulator n=1 Tax=Clostridium acetobutylicum (strain ATCC 824 / DSM 792 / JCM 1419 / IAM 19013 / LMG 5710 / NBRC 13948 / NRRL B-527 / VKM B-1787 / 2291 / W) TaxID=272562 RepID=Q97HY7_CLOAB|nr:MULTISPECIES: helix-turn-helix transcriptional regulator [Clostridium]AAK79833.1 Predicted transcriptional regulator [Clostridium acetobutylicum ATCC 824]ADZ20919.1 transcriptional regulator [Clostridium acetobutylicum EA 2018]AEI32012.1 transcriptional regulator [Clostridium acetobutylicum DSM 1731]AWV79737.1 transcriptional regulator [Clostridium acetobutylicum]MBC2394285.1 helix-turn-helix transcriptional regulator [Clostridium acetobutylicum]